MKKYADCNCAESVKYKPGDQVLLSLENIKTRRPKVKWSDKRTGPYTIIKEENLGSDLYVLQLPKSWNVYLVFHTLLTPYCQNTFDNCVQPLLPAVVIDGNKEYEIEKIVDSRVCYGHTQYLVKWVGYQNTL